MKRLYYLLISLFLLVSVAAPISAENEITIFSEYYYMVDLSNDQVILDQGGKDVIYPASLTKIMTLIVAIENIQNLDELVKLDQNVFAGLIEANASMAGFGVNEKVSLKDCLYGLFLPSGADAARAIAFYVADTEAGFVKLMNEKAVELGMENTNFTNTTGLHNKDHTTTLYDLSLLVKYCMNNSEFMEIFTTDTYTATSTSMHANGLTWQSNLFKALEFLNYNGLDPQVILGGKTGYTIPAGLCQASIAENNGTQYLLITAHAPADSVPYHIIDATNIYNMVFNDYEKKTWVSPDDMLGQAKLEFNLSNSKIPLMASEQVQLTLPNSVNLEDVKMVLTTEDQYNAPIKKGDVLGVLQFQLNDQVIYSTEVTAQNDYRRSSLLYGVYQFRMWIMEHLILAIVFLAFLGFLIWRLFVIRKKLQGLRK